MVGKAYPRTHYEELKNEGGVTEAEVIPVPMEPVVQAVPEEPKAPVEPLAEDVPPQE